MRAGRFHAAVVWWETTALPDDWKLTLSRLDAIVAFSGFIHQSMANLIPLTSILEGKQPFETPQPTAFKRADLGLPEEATLFIGSFDPQGDPARKNPAAMPLAFRRAFPLRTENACLLVRVNHADASRFGSAAMEQMRVAAEDDPRIGFLQGKMSQAQLHGLFRCADAYVSLHRAEGLGFGMLEAMALAKPVIATAWSGNTSFMSSTSGCMVRYRPVPICGNYESYRPETLGQGAVWAEPVIEDAVAWMQALHADPELRRRIGGNARAQFLRYQQAADELAWVQGTRGPLADTQLAAGRIGKVLQRICHRCALIFGSPLRAGRRSAIAPATGQRLRSVLRRFARCRDADVCQSAAIGHPRLGQARICLSAGFSQRAAGDQPCPPR